jgi:Tol biopolymer transport system component
MAMLVAAVSLSVAAAACGGSDGETGGAVSEPRRATAPVGIIAYVDLDDGDFSVATIRADGTDDSSLVPYASAPAWSPDGTRVAVGQDTIWIYDAAGKNGQELGRGLGLCDEPAWSPDGRRVACIGPTDAGSMSLNYDDPASLWLIDVDTKRPSRLVDFVGGGWGEYPDAPSWSPDGTRLVFSVDVSADEGEIRVLELENGRVHDLGLGTSPDWSPRGDAIAYSTGRALVVSRPDGTGRRTIATSADLVQEPSWSPDSTRIVYAVYSEEGLGTRWGAPRGLRIVAASGGEVSVLTRSGFDPDWRPGS